MAKVLDMSKHKDTADMIGTQIALLMYSMVIHEHGRMDNDGMIQALACEVRDVASSCVWLNVDDDWIEEVE